MSSIPAALFALGGAALAVITAHLLGAESDLVSAGLLGFSPVLTAITVGTVFYAPSVRVALYAALATVFTVIVQAAMNVAFAPLGVPALTAPFVLTAWLFLLPRQHLGAGDAPDDDPPGPTRRHGAAAAVFEPAPAADRGAVPAGLRAHRPDAGRRRRPSRRACWPSSARATR